MSDDVLQKEFDSAADAVLAAARHLGKLVSRDEYVKITVETEDGQVAFLYSPVAIQIEAVKAYLVAQLTGVKPVAAEESSGKKRRLAADETEVPEEN